MFKIGIGQDSHRFVEGHTSKKLVLGGVVIENSPALEGNSDADVILHAITNAISGVSCKNILGRIADDMCLKEGITDSKAYLKAALDTLNDYKITHVSISIEALKPKLEPYIEKIRESIANLLDINKYSVGITATTGEGLTKFGQGEGIFCTAIVTAQHIISHKSD